uniref:GG11091 n=1 Tax=Drosophila erecta TaxID=7220 RepID=B3P8Q8_DROER
MSHKEASSWSRMQVNLSPKHYNRLYDAYRERLKGDGSGNVDVEAKMESKDPVPPQRDVTSLPKKTEKLMAKEKDTLEFSNIKFDATDDRFVTSGNCLARLPFGNGENQTVKAMVEAKAEDKLPLVSSMILLKLDVPEDMLQVKTPEKVKDPGERRIFELNRIYNDFLKAWQKPTPSLNSKSVPAKPLSSSGSVKLSALSDLMDVIERLQKSDLVKELAEKINEEMEPNLQKQIKQDALLVTDSRASLRAIKKNDLSGIFENVEPGSATNAFKRLIDDINSRRSSIKAGGLYDEYKKGFCQLFSDHKFPRESHITSEADYPLDNESRRRMNSDDILPSRCENPKATTVECDIAESKATTKNCVPIEKPTPKSHQCDKPKATTPKCKEPESKTPTKTCAPIETPQNNNYLKALETFIKMNKESNENGGLKPYYLPNSKNRQLVWNDIPLIKPGLNESPKKTLESKPQYKSSSTPIQENVVPEKKPDKVTYSKSDFKTEIKVVESVPKTQAINPWQSVFSGLDPKQIIGGLKAIKHTSFFNLVDEYQKQIDSLNQALKTKQSWWKEVLEKGRHPARTPMKRNIPLNNNPAGSVLQTPFPEVLVNQPSQLGSNNVIDSMATQMNLSPLEVAQRIVGTGQNPVDGRIRFAPSHIQTASQIGTSFKKGSEIIPCTPTQAPQQQPEDQLGISPVLDKILERLESIQASKSNQSSDEEEEKKLPCCFVDPADGAPCDLNGSWESLVLGIRINIKSPPTSGGVEKEKPTCSQHKDRAYHRARRQCVKMNKSQLKNAAEQKAPNYQGIKLNISVQETVPPRAHDLLDNLTDWHFSGQTMMTLGGPISLSFRKANSNLIGHFVGYCRTCGCVDTIFGSWSFCKPSRDCQDICMSIVDRRDMLRRYSMDERRKNRFKELLYMGSKFAKMEKERQQAELVKCHKLQHQAPGETNANSPNTIVQS